MHVLHANIKCINVEQIERENTEKERVFVCGRGGSRKALKDKKEKEKDRYGYEVVPCAAVRAVPAPPCALARGDPPAPPRAAPSVLAADWPPDMQHVIQRDIQYATTEMETAIRTNKRDRETHSACVYIRLRARLRVRRAAACAIAPPAPPATLTVRWLQTRPLP